MDKEVSLDDIPNVDIDEEGKFKYIQIEISNETSKKIIVRGYGYAEYHSDIFDSVSTGFEALGIKYECVGGGRIIHTPDAKTLEIYGFSQGYGKADHTLTQKLLSEAYPDYNVIISDKPY